MFFLHRETPFAVRGREGHEKYGLERHTEIFLKVGCDGFAR